jgi:hypothetical protein
MAITHCGDRWAHEMRENILFLYSLIHSFFLPATHHGHPSILIHRRRRRPPGWNGFSAAPNPKRLPSSRDHRSLLPCFLASGTQQVYAARALERAGGSLEHQSRRPCRAARTPTARLNIIWLATPEVSADPRLRAVMAGCSAR